MTTLRDVARRAGVSTMTASRVVNKSRSVKADTRARVESAIAQLGFVPGEAGRLQAQQKCRTRLSLTRCDSGEVVGYSSDQAIVKGELALRPATGRRDLSQASSHLSGDTVRTVLRIVRAAQPISRVDLARRLEVNRSTVSGIVSPLIASGVLCEAAPEEAPLHRRGRPPIGLTLRGDRSFLIGVNIGVRRTQVGAAATDGRMLDEKSFDTPADSNKAMTQIRSVVGQLRTALPELSLVSIGVSVPGPTDAGRRKLLFAPHLGWRNVPVADALIENEAGSDNSRKGVPVIVENDATAAAIYEARRRLRARTPGTQDNFILVRAGTGIGVGLVLGGEVYRGSGTDRGLLGEFGHMTIVAGGDPCACGNRGCWEVYASAAGAASIYLGSGASARGRTPPRFIEIVARAGEGELRAQTTLARIGENLGIGISNVITGLGVSRVVISGRIVHGWMFIRKSLEEAVAQTMAGRLSNWSIEPGQPTGAGLGGAVEVAIDHYLTELARSMRAAA
ncbi:MAG TPA: ROK family protein [Pyrinomonadaceae bacterium]|nr:ROK family protein [Pyrinomonadaceae bacterium]